METFTEFPNPHRKRLRGMIHKPSGASGRKRAPGVVFFHGFTGDRMESHWIFVKCARALEAAGIASLRFDFYGSGESDGDFGDATLRGEIADARVAVEFFRNQKGIDPPRVGLLGISLGGLIAAAVAGTVRARALVLWSAVAHSAHLRTLAETSTKPIAGRDGAVEYEAREISPRFLHGTVDLDPPRRLGRFKGPTLIVHPGADEVVPFSHAEEYYRAAGARVKELVVIPKADHVFTSIRWEHEVIQRSVEWLRAHLQ
jgi:hypothetical protein